MNNHMCAQNLYPHFEIEKLYSRICFYSTYSTIYFPISKVYRYFWNNYSEKLHISAMVIPQDFVSFVADFKLNVKLIGYLWCLGVVVVAVIMEVGAVVVFDGV